jgi:hypothetical protein
MMPSLTDILYQLCFASVRSFFELSFVFYGIINKSTAFTSKQHSLFLSHDGFHKNKEFF